MLQKSFGREVLRRVVLGITKWERVPAGVRGTREEELKTKFWKTMMEQGSAVHQFRGDFDSAWKTIDSLLDEVEDDTLHIQKGLVELQRLIPENTASRQSSYYRFLQPLLQLFGLARSY